MIGLIFVLCCILLVIGSIFLNLILYDIESKEIRKKLFIILPIIFTIVSLIFIFYGKNILFVYLYSLISMSLLSIFILRLVKVNKIKKIENNVEKLCFLADCLWFLLSYWIITLILLGIEKVNSFSIFKYIIEVYLFIFLIEIISMKILHNKNINKRSKKEMNIIITIVSVIYIVYIIFVNPNYMYIRIISAIFVVIVTIIILYEKINSAVQIFLLAVFVVFGVIVIVNVYDSQIESKVISTTIENIHVNTNRSELLNYDVGERFILFDREKIENNEELIIYIIAEENGEVVIKEDKRILDYYCETTDGQWCLQEFKERLVITNNNLSRNKNSNMTDTNYFLYYK